MNTFTRLRHVWRTHVVAADAVLAVAVLLVVGLPRALAPPFVDPVTAAELTALAIGCAALVLRRTAPVAVLVVTTLIAAASVVVGGGIATPVGPAFVALFTVASRVTWGRAVAAALAQVGVLTLALATAGLEPWGDVQVVGLFGWCGMVTAVGIAVRAQRAVVESAEERAARAEHTREEEAARRVGEERLRIARELHDVLAHHVAVVGVQAGVAEVLMESRPDAARTALGHVQSATETALAELGDLLEVLRDAADDDAATRPAPGLANLDELVDRSRATGLLVNLHRGGAREQLPALADHAAYRIVQEGLTNAHKHGTGRAELLVEQSPVELRVRVENPDPTGAGRTGGSGYGLVGIRERVTAVGGTMRAESVAGTFVLEAYLPIRRGSG
ncbi:sensor histidine kinase [Paraoerskovia marina]|uniref:sensor histidine kinase n=1 Tax=Paraoerskovia marina TaxID=545619 RepID=UPI0004923CC1|nr:histidine kinase [Paraoerskovia marina]